MKFYTIFEYLGAMIVVGSLMTLFDDMIFKHWQTYAVILGCAIINVSGEYKGNDDVLR